MLLGLLAAIGTLAAWSFGTLVFFKASRIIAPSLLNRTRLLLAAIVTGVIVMVFNGFGPWRLITDPTTMQWVWLGLSGLVGLSIGDFMGFTGLRILGARRQSVVMTTAPAAAAIGAWLLLDETLSFVGILGMALSIGGVMWSLAGTHERKAVHSEGFGTFTTGVLLAFGGALCQGFGLVLAKMGMVGQGAEVSAVHATFMRMGVAFFGAYLVDYVRRDRVRPMKEAFATRKGTNTILLATVLGPVVGVSLSLYAAREIGVAVAQTIFSLIPLVVMSLAAIQGHERLRLRPILGAVIAVVGVAILVTQN